MELKTGMEEISAVKSSKEDHNVVQNHVTVPVNINFILKEPVVDGTNPTSVIISGKVNLDTVRNLQISVEENTETSGTTNGNQNRIVKETKINNIVLAQRGKEKTLVDPLADTQPRGDPV